MGNGDRKPDRPRPNAHTVEDARLRTFKERIDILVADMKEIGKAVQAAILEMLSRRLGKKKIPEFDREPFATSRKFSLSEYRRVVRGHPDVDAEVGPQIARNLKRLRRAPSPRWRLDERIGGRHLHLWRAVDDEGEAKPAPRKHPT